MTPQEVIVVSDDEVFAQRMVAHLSAQSFGSVRAMGSRPGLQDVSRASAVLVDLAGSELGLEWIRAVTRGDASRLRVIALVPNLTIRSTVEVMKAGASDVIERSAPVENILDQARALVAEKGLWPLTVAEGELVKSLGDQVLVTNSAALRSTLDRVQRLAKLSLPVTLIGERSAGQEQLVERLHRGSDRAQFPLEIVRRGPSVEVDRVLLGASGSPGAIERAWRGTLYIESVSSLSDRAQEQLAMLLGGESALRGEKDAVGLPRLIMGSDREIADELASSKLRPDLARRLGTLTIRVPALRERKEDLPALFRSMAAEACERIGLPVMAQLDELSQVVLHHDFEGNLLELEAAALRAAVLSRHGAVRPDEVIAGKHATALGGSEGRSHWAPGADVSGRVRRYDEYEAEIFRFALDQLGGCVSRAAEALGVGRATMYRKMRSYQIALPPTSERGIGRTPALKDRAA